jgi:hypothetical protein
VIPTFEDRHPGFDASDVGGYGVTNEEPDIFRRMLRGKRFNKVGCISSAGDMLLYTLLSKSKQVVAVDHCYRSLSAAYAKIILFHEYGAEDGKKIIMNDAYGDFVKKIENLKGAFPEKVWERKPFLGSNHYNPISSHDWLGCRREVFYTPDSTLRAALKRLDRVTFVHGDFSDIAEDGPFDLLYISNFLGHRDRAGRYPSISVVKDMLKNGGYLLSCVTNVGDREEIRDLAFLEIESMKGIRTNWKHFLHQKVTRATEQRKGREDSAIGASTNAASGLVAAGGN